MELMEWEGGFKGMTKSWALTKVWGQASVCEYGNIWAKGEFYGVQELKETWANLEATGIINVKWPQGL